MPNLMTSSTPDTSDSSRRILALLPVRLAALVIAGWMAWASFAGTDPQTEPILLPDTALLLTRFLSAAAFTDGLLLLPAVPFCLLDPGALGRWLGWRRGLGRTLWIVIPVYLFMVIGCEAILVPVETPEEQDMLTLLRLFSPFQRAVAAVVICGVVPVAEELFFRGVLGGRSAPAILFSAALFAAVHGTAGFFLPLFFFGTVQGLLCRRTGSLIPAILLHALFNGVTLLFV